ncbi:uncharacterized protein PV09_08258 [Verruconis gallopava]|uniref:Stress-response A/B barrel domain-containing protein n=1 Tax=Verruconis gallopava TaxID=253628 RepID=A0A0D2A0N1_9PEZI|nr:uncharacterized protein PV09_08258 [Verruconis gallopava]KIW00218.1 hypothetical protein PV09_08258 [Verruconis gallopava]
MAPITRVTMIKLREEDIDMALKGFETFAKTQTKEGKPYILSMEAGPARGSVRDQGYTFVTKSVFTCVDDQKFYEDKCPAHQEYKTFLKENTSGVSGLISVNFEPSCSFSI